MVINISKEKILFVSLIIILLLGLSVASAADNTTVKDVKVQKTLTKTNHTSNIKTKTITKNKDLNVTKKVTNAKENTKKITNTNKKVKTASTVKVNNFTQLKEIIENAQETSITLSLDGDKVYTAGDSIPPITVNENLKKLTINGNGRTFDGEKQYGFLESYKNTAIVINNMTVTNCSSLSAVNIENGSLTVNNVKFIENGFGNNIVYDGGALKVINAPLTVKNCLFESNFGEYASAIYYNHTKGTLKIENTNFISNGGMKQGRLANGGIINLINITNLIIKNSTFNSNKAFESPVSLISNFKTNIDISDSIFEENSMNYYYEGSRSGALWISTNNTQMNIRNCTFKSNKGIESGAITYYTLNGNPNNYNYDDIRIYNCKFINNTGNPYCESGAISLGIGGTVDIDSCEFTSNCGEEGVLCLYNPYYYENDYYNNVRINNTNFTDNYPVCYEYEIEMEGVINAQNINLLVNNSNFNGNGLKDIEENYFEEEMIPGICIINGNLTLDYTNFTANVGALGMEESLGSLIYVDGNITFNHTIFKDNLLYNLGYDEESGIGCVILYMSDTGSRWIDNCKFISNHVLTNQNNDEFWTLFGSIQTEGLNVTNSEFINNTPLNFIIKNNTIQMNTMMEHVLDDLCIPDHGIVTIYLDENTEGKTYTLNTKEVDGLNVPYVEDFTVSEDNYLIKMVVNQTKESNYYNIEEFYNNAYYLLIPQNFTITVNATDVKIGENSKIKGKLYYTKKDGSKAVFSDKEIELYINGTYITKTTTNKNGEYTFNYPTESIGNQTVQVKFNGGLYLPKVTNTTTFNVEKLKTTISLTTKNIPIGYKTNITGKVIDNLNNPVKNAKLKVFVDNKEYTVTTDNQGTFKFEYYPTYIGEHHILTEYDGNYSHEKNYTTLNFNVTKIKTKITITATNTYSNEETSIKGKLTDIKNKAIANAKVTIYDGKNIITTVTTDKNGEYTLKYKTTKTGKINLTSEYDGNDNYTSTKNTTSITVKDSNDVNTKITVKSVTVKDTEKVKLTATIKTLNNKLVEDGKVSFKINGKTLMDKQGNIIYATVKNGKATLNYNPPDGLYNKKSNITATYSQSKNYRKSTSKTAELNIIKRTATITLNKKSIKTPSYKTITLKATIKDEKGTKIKTGTVTFKINNNTIQKVKIKNGIATLKYKLKQSSGKYTITAVYSSYIHNRIEKTIKLSITKIPTKINAKIIKSNNNKVTLKATITDDKNKNIKDKTKVSIKIDNQTYINETKVSKGKINIKIPTKLSKGTYNMTILSGVTGHYKSTKKNLKLTITN